MLCPRITTVRGKAWVQGHQGANTLVLPLVLVLTRALPTWIRWDKNWPERVCIHEPRVLTILHIPGVQDVVKREKKQSHIIESAMPSFLTLIYVDSESWPRQRRRRVFSTHHVQTQEKGPPCSLRSSRPSYEVDFQPVMCTIFPTPHIPIDDTGTTSSQDPHLLAGSLSCHVCVCLCQPCPAYCNTAVSA